MKSSLENRWTILLVGLLVIIALPDQTSSQSSGGTFQITNSVVANGGGKSSDGNSNGLAHESTMGENAAGTLLRNPPYSQKGGYAAASLGLAPSAAPGAISGQVTTNNGAPLGGVVIALSGLRTARTITNASGFYSFSDIETGGFYSVVPLRANYSFSPASRAFSLVGNKTDATFTASPGAETSNPLDTPEFFVRQQYIDFLSREPDRGGFEYWSRQINQCGDDQTCTRAKRVDVSNAFFYEQEFQATGAYVYRIYKAALDQPPTFGQFISDRGHVIGGPQLDQSKTDFANAFVQRPQFVAQYPDTMTAGQYVDALNAKTGDVLTQRERDELVSGLTAGTETRGTALRKIADCAAFVDREYNASFVLTQYFGYLHRDPDRPGFAFWLGQVNGAPLRDVPRQHAMVCSFITSAEYQLRFSSVVTHSNTECPQ